MSLNLICGKPRVPAATGKPRFNPILDNTALPSCEGVNSLLSLEYPTRNSFKIFAENVCVSDMYVLSTTVSLELNKMGVPDRNFVGCGSTWRVKRPDIVSRSLKW